MNAQELILNIAVNMGRLGRWCMEGKIKRVEQFLAETNEYLVLLDKAPKNQRFEKTLSTFKQNFQALKNQTNYDESWAERAYTWANILTHRARLA